MTMSQRYRVRFNDDRAVVTKEGEADEILAFYAGDEEDVEIRLEDEGYRMVGPWHYGFGTQHATVELIPLGSVHGVN